MYQGKRGRIMGRTSPSSNVSIPGYLRLIALAASLLVLTAAWPAWAQEDWACFTAKAFTVIDAQTGKTLLSNNAREMIPPASTLKVMTALYALDHLKMDDKVRVSAYAASAPPSKINIKAGECYTVRELLYALLLSSANDGARALAEAACGSEATFAQKVTQQVRQWGAYRTTCATANGLPNDNQYTTAEDLAQIFRLAMQNPEFAKIVSTKYYDIQGERELRNHDRFLFTTPLARGGKTGYTRASQHTYVGMFQNQDKAIIIAMLGSKKMWADLRTLIEKGFALEGKPIAKLEPLEERLHFARNHMGNSIGAEEVSYKKVKKKKRTCRRRTQVKSKESQLSVSSLAEMPSKKNTRGR
jgi:D-alanyl-D-alanine carboxypeptidase (penicillin-binding protein 5/6)